MILNSVTGNPCKRLNGYQLSRGDMLEIFLFFSVFYLLIYSSQDSRVSIFKFVKSVFLKIKKEKSHVLTSPVFIYTKLMMDIKLLI